MKWSHRIMTVFAAVAVGLAGAQSTARGPAQGYWVDPETNLMWVGQDNGKNVSWRGANKYCKNLRVAGYSDWRMANIAELSGLYDKNVEVPGLNGAGREQEGFTWHVKGNLFLTGDEWSSDYRTDDRGKIRDMYITLTSMKADPTTIQLVSPTPTMVCACYACDGQ